MINNMIKLIGCKQNCNDYFFTLLRFIKLLIIFILIFKNYNILTNLQ